MSSALSLRALDHVHITTPEELENEVLEWYAECLGLERLEKPGGTREQSTWFAIGDRGLHVSRDEHNPSQESHFAIEADDLDAVVGRLRAAGCHIEQAATIPGRRRFYTRDPAGNRIEFLSYEAEKESGA